ncbi:SKU5-like protein, partial [Striga asiatica]
PSPLDPASSPSSEAPSHCSPPTTSVPTSLCLFLASLDDLPSLAGTSDVWVGSVGFRAPLSEMGRAISLYLVAVFAFWSVLGVRSEDAYKYYTWTVTYGTAAPLGVSQQVILINGQFPGPRLDTVTNDNIILNLINKLDQPILLTWNGIKQRKNSWQDGVLGTNCPIPPNTNYTYKFQTKDQIGSYSYFPSTLMHRAAGGFGALNVYARSVIPVPYATPAGDYSLLVGDWYKAGHKASGLQQILDSGKPLPSPDGILINGQGHSSFSGNQGKTYMFRVSNIGLSTSINFRIQGHKMKLVEVEGSHVLQNIYDSLDIHVGQSVSVLITLNQSPKDYYIVASTRFTQAVLTATGVLHYTNSQAPVNGPIPAGPTIEVDWSIDQARSYRTIILANTAPLINGKQRYAVNGVSYINPDTPLKLADHYNIPGVFIVNSIQSTPSGGGPSLGTSVLGASLHDFIEVVFQNNEDTIQSWHLDGYDFWVVGFGNGQWTQASRQTYNLDDALTRHTTQVYPKSWTAILVSLDNQGMWNLRSAMWGRQYLGQQLYLRVYNPTPSFANEYDIPNNALLCGRAVGRKLT